MSYFDYLMFNLLCVKALGSNAFAVPAQEINVGCENFLRGLQRASVLGRICRQPHIRTGRSRVYAVHA